MARELQAQFAQESKRREAGSLAEDPHQGRAGDPGFRGKRVERPGPRGRHQHGCHGTGRRRRDQKLHEIIGTCRLIEMTPEHHDEKGAGEILGNGRSPGPASLELFIDGLNEHAHRDGIAAWKALRDLLPRDEDVPSGSPTVGIGQLFIAAHKEINRLEQMKTVPPVIDVIAEPALALAKLTDMRDGAGGGQPAASVSHGPASRPPARVQSETAQDGDHVEW